MSNRLFSSSEDFIDLTDSPQPPARVAQPPTAEEKPRIQAPQAFRSPASSSNLPQANRLPPPSIPQFPPFGSPPPLPFAVASRAPVKISQQEKSFSTPPQNAPKSSLSASLSISSPSPPAVATASAKQEEKKASSPAPPMDSEKKSSSSTAFSSSPPSNASVPCSNATLNTVDYVGIFQSKLPGLSNVYSLGLSDFLIHSKENPILALYMGNYKYDFPWLLQYFPFLTEISSFTCFLGEKDFPREKIEEIRAFAPNLQISPIPMPLPYGVHHSKFLLSFYRSGLRLGIFTGNFIPHDWKYKNQVNFIQDFPYKTLHGGESTSTIKESLFERELILYFQSYRNFALLERLKTVDFSSARVRLIFSVPGKHSRQQMAHYGHIKMRRVLAEAREKEIPSSSAAVGSSAPPLPGTLICQYSSMGSITERWYQEFLVSMTINSQHVQIPSGIPEKFGVPAASTSASYSPPSLLAAKFSSPPHVKFIWPTAEQVQNSLEGWLAGGSLCLSAKNYNKSPLANIGLHRWEANSSFLDDQRRSLAMPHQKTFLYCTGEGKLSYFLLTSANFSQAAWGALQLENSQLTIRNYELGVLFLPEAYKINQNQLFSSQTFSCTPERAGGGEIRHKTPRLKEFPLESRLSSSGGPLEVEFCLLRQSTRIDYQKGDYGKSLFASGTGKRDRPAESENDGDDAENQEKRRKSSSASSSSVESSDEIPKTLRILFPLCYSIHSSRYSPRDQPWRWDFPFQGRDSHGKLLQIEAEEENEG